ncbi:MAG: hypothetical protein LBV19_09025 [Streptococcaceae bacterium]|nr:hypothetical protein [Streptococcaceae bacterium]
MMIIFFTIIIHQGIEQTLALTDTGLLKMSRANQLAAAIFCLFIGLGSFTYPIIVHKGNAGIPRILKDKYLYFDDTMLLMAGLLLVSYALTVFYFLRREGRTNES